MLHHVRAMMDSHLMPTDQKSVELQKSPSCRNTLQVIDELILHDGCPENCCYVAF